MVGARLQLWALIGLAFVAGVLGIYMSGVQRGIDRQRSKLDRDRLNKIGQAKEIEDAVNADPHLVDRAKQWVRKDD